MSTTMTNAAGDALAPVFELINVSKRFGAVAALQDVTIALHPGECVVLLGENGAGKSTLVGSILGRHRISEGSIRIRGRAVDSYSAAVALHHGVRAVTQEFNLCESQSVYANIYLGQEETTIGFRRKGHMVREARRRLREINAQFEPTDQVANLTRAEQQLVEICKAVTHGGEPGVILFDEPTAAISATESLRLFEIIDRLKADGWAVLYISHRMEELRRVGDRVVVLRDGRQVATHALAEVTDDELVNEMAGREVESSFPEKGIVGTGAEDPVLAIEGLSTDNGRVLDVSLTVRPGEILGVGGLVGSGKGDVGAALFGITSIRTGVVRVEGRRITRPSARRMYAAGVGYLAEDRKREGILTGTAVGLNMLIERVAMGREYTVAGFVRKDRLRSRADDLVRKFDVRPATSRTMPIGQLSGGNQQKALVARALAADRTALVVVEPTAGVDVGSRMEIYRHLRAECHRTGIGILLISSDVEELVGMSDRVLVMHAGRISTELVGDEITPANIVAGSFGSEKGTLS